MRALWQIIRLARSQWWALVGVSLVGLSVSGLFVAVGIVLARALDLVYSGGSTADVAPLLGAALGLLALRAVATWWYARQAAAVAADVKADLRERLYRHVLRLGPAWATGARTGQVQGVLTDGVDALERVYSSLLVQTAVSFLAGSVIALYILSVDPVVGAVVLAALLGLPLTVVVSKRVLRGTGDLWWQTYGELHATYVDHLQGIVTLKVFDAAHRRGRDLDRRSLAFRDAAVATMGRESTFSAAVTVLAGVGGALSVGLGALRVAQGELGLADLLLLLFLARECFRPLTDLTRGFHMAYYGLVVAKPMLELLATEPAVADSGTTPLPRTGRAPRVELSGVTFRYPGSDTDSLQDVDLALEPGETVAVVGRSGAGKSTCVQLLMRLHDVGAGSVRIDGVDVRDVPLQQLRRSISLVAQDTHLFGGTVRDNLRLARPDATDDDMWRSLEAASAADFVRALPDGLDTVVGDRGVRLSGGERQRVAIARALLEDAPLLVLDEATSNLDVANEASIKAALDRLRAGRTTLVVAHRLSTVRDAHRVVVLDTGRVIEEGPPVELERRTDGAYARLVTRQTGAMTGGAV